jgi:DNA polymerase-3 subunit gamma/tau
MSYQVLARKWRPRSFREMVGQEHVLRALINALDNDRLHHAFLFTGTRGVGKTTVARILAKCMNCEAGVGSEPCGTCSSCTAIDEGRFVDLIEVDAASRTKVEDTRELLENVQYAPTQGRYKVYLIDEVHMLSSHSFNALLKTLEEPPPHVKFLLATTDPQKLPVTILSRCLQFNLKHLAADRISAYLQEVMGREQIPFDGPAIDEIARAADGSMRDALSLLDQAIAYGGGELREQPVRAMLGCIDRDHVHRLLGAVNAGDGVALLEAIERLAEQAPDYQAVLGELLSALHRIALVQTVPEAGRNADTEAAILELAQAMSPEDAQLFYQIGLHGRRDLPHAPDPRTGFEMALLRMLAFRPVDGGAGARSVEGASDAAGGGRASAPPATAEPARPAPAAPAAAGDWRGIVESLPVRGIARELALNCSLASRDGDRFQLDLDASHAQLLSKNTQQRLQDALRKQFGEGVTLDIRVGSGEEQATPAREQARERRLRQQEAERDIARDPGVLALQEAFGATIVPGSIEPLDG